MNSNRQTNSGKQSAGQRRPLEVQAHIPEPSFDVAKDPTDDGDDLGHGDHKDSEMGDGEETVEELKSTGHDSRKNHLSAVNIMMETGNAFIPAVIERVGIKYPPINFSVLQKSPKQIKNYYGKFQKIIDNVIKMRRTLLMSPAQRTARSMKIQTDFSGDPSARGTSKMVVTMNPGATSKMPEVHRLPRVPIFSENKVQHRESPTSMINFSQVVKFAEQPNTASTLQTQPSVINEQSTRELMEDLLKKFSRPARAVQPLKGHQMTLKTKDDENFDSAWQKHNRKTKGFPKRQRNSMQVQLQNTSVGDVCDQDLREDELPKYHMIVEPDLTPVPEPEAGQELVAELISKVDASIDGPAAENALKELSELIPMSPHQDKDLSLTFDKPSENQGPPLLKGLAQHQSSADTHLQRNASSARKKQASSLRTMDQGSRIGKNARVLDPTMQNFHAAREYIERQLKFVHGSGPQSQFMVQLNIDSNKPSIFNLARSPLPRMLSRSPSIINTSPSPGSILSARGDQSFSTAILKNDAPTNLGYRIAEEQLIAKANEGIRGYALFES